MGPCDRISVAEGPHPQPADSQKNPRGTAAATSQGGRCRTRPDGGTRTRQPAARARTMATSGLRIGRLTRSRWCSLLQGRWSQACQGRRRDALWFVSLHREGRGIYRGGGQREKVGSVDDTVRALLLPAPARRALRTAGLSHSRNHSSTWALKTQGRACLIARMLSLVILNSISMANGSPAAGSYSSSNSSWTTSRCSLN